MKLLVEVISWFMLAIGVLAIIGLTIEANQGQTGNGAGIAISLVWILQSILTLQYLHTVKEIK